MATAALTWPIHVPSSLISISNLLIFSHFDYFLQNYPTSPKISHVLLVPSSRGYSGHEPIPTFRLWISKWNFNHRNQHIWLYLRSNFGSTRTFGGISIELNSNCGGVCFIEFIAFTRLFSSWKFSWCRGLEGESQNLFWNATSFVYGWRWSDSFSPFRRVTCPCVK